MGWVLCCGGRHESAMPRYFFHVRDGDELILLDREGLELPNHEFVPSACQSLVREVLDEDQSRAELLDDRQFEIVDEQGRLVLNIPFRAVVPI